MILKPRTLTFFYIDDIIGLKLFMFIILFKSLSWREEEIA